MLVLLCCMSYCFRNSSTGSDFVYLSYWSHRYCSAVIGACLYMLVVPSYCSSSLGYLYYVGLVIVIVISLPQYSAMGPSITIFPLGSYCRPHGRKSIISGSIIIFICLLTNTLWCSSSLSMFIGTLFIIGIIPLVG